MKIQFPIPFAKMSGTGNDFIIIDNRDNKLDGISMQDFARSVCRRKFSVGADGLILIERSGTADFSWQFFNGDGSVAEMCGNGARCAARFAFEKKIAPADMHFATLAGVIEASIRNDASGSVRIRLTAPENINLNRRLQIGGGEKVIHSINTGVPHVVMMVDDAAIVPVVDWGRTLRYHESFQPAGTNVNFVQVIEGNGLLVRTYERGVEDETMACGTGAVASALVGALLGMVKPPVPVTTSGGETLVIDFSFPQGDETLREPENIKVFLEGPAHLIYEGNICVDAIS
jgi:diaminopimelate epimerase